MIYILSCENLMRLKTKPFAAVITAIIIIIVSATLIVNFLHNNSSNDSEEYTNEEYTDDELEKMKSDICAITGENSAVIKEVSEYNSDIMYIYIDPEYLYGDRYERLIDYIDNQILANSLHQFPRIKMIIIPDTPEDYGCYVSNIFWRRKTNVPVSDKMFYMFMSRELVGVYKEYSHITYLELGFVGEEAETFAKFSDMKILTHFPDLEVLDLSGLYLGFFNEEETDDFLNRLREAIPENCEILLE